MRVEQLKENIFLIKSKTFVSNTYVVTLSNSKDCIIIDPGLDGELIDRGLRSLNLHPVAVCCTHGHFDHVGSSFYFQEKYEAEVILHQKDYKIAKASNFLMMACKIKGHIIIPEFNKFVRGETEEVEVTKDDKVEYFSVPGHTPGSCVVAYQDNIFTGDTLYAKSVSLVKLPGENPKQLKQSIKSIFKRYNKKTSVFPGHGTSSSLEIISVENKKLIEFLAES